MTDSFFTARNSFDHQFANWHPGTCEEIIEAAVRRMVRCSGPQQTAQRIQRIADICGGSFISADLETLIREAGREKPKPKKQGRLARAVEIALKPFGSPVRLSRATTAESALADDIRALGWSVAVHNDYRLNGETYTFWLFTNGDKAIKGEGRTDAEALNVVRTALATDTDGRG